ncbi:MAG: NADH-quinone oxidoreductase subunit NuoF [Candidatus Delongbacteria bacterium]|jgi:NADH-quinone oxidoreductase E subunit|nr:NADH-quinone oxidoreductase subunit NuoF [Candidatus Delongbacteria bacterium]
MIDQSMIDKITELKAKYPKKESALMPALMLAQKANSNNLSEEDMEKVAALVGVTSGKAFGVATYYSMYNAVKNVGKYHLQVDTNIPATLMGALKIVDYLEKKLGIKEGETTKDGLFTLSTVECLGSCGTCPVVQVNDVYYENMTTEKLDSLISSLQEGVMPVKEVNYNFGTECNVLLKNRGLENSTSIDTYIQTGGYKALEKAMAMEPQAITNEVRNSAIRGRGGAGFPAGVKWGFLPKNTGKPIYLICNADEGEPGTFKDRQIMEYDPHLLVEGMIISAKAIDSNLGFIYIRGEFEWIADILEKAIEEAKVNNKMSDIDIIVHRGAGAYVCGEETALIESIEGKRGQPRMKPPFPAVEGLYGCPTIVNNVETLASVPFIIDKGAEAFKAFGYENNTGFKLFGISGAVNKPGVYEYPMGISFNKLIEAAGGVKGNLKAAIVGGLSVPILKPEELNNLNMDYDSCIKHGTGLGSGGIMVISDEFSIPELALRTIQFYAHESCGKCAPCKEGSHTIVMILKKLLAGHGTIKDIAKLEEIVNTINNVGSTLCPTGQAFAMPIKAMIEKFRDEFTRLIK